MTRQVTHTSRMDASSFTALLAEPIADGLREQHDWFALCEVGVNPMIDKVTPLLGLVQRVRHLNHFSGITRLYQQVVADIQEIEQALTIRGYDKAELLSFRYMLCSFIDEAVMSQEWGSQSEWSEHSLLARFHNETWGGEKVFVLLSRLQEEPERYRHTLEFIYLCLCLGFEGRYRVISNGAEELSLLRRRLHSILMPGMALRPFRGFHLDLAGQPVTSVTRRALSLSGWLLMGGVGLLVTFGLYAHRLHIQSQELLEQLGQLLK